MVLPHPLPAVALRGLLRRFAPVLIAIAVAGCASSDGPRPPRRFGETERQAPLAGTSSFLGGTLQAAVQVGPFMRQAPGPETKTPDDTDRPQRHGGGAGFSGGVGGMQFGGGGGGDRGGMGGRGGEHDGPPSDGPGGEAHFGRGPDGPRGPGLGFPRQTLRVTFTNAGPAPLKIEVTELRSLIGNFAPQPDRLELAPGASATLNPVSGDAGGVLETLEVTLSVRRGDDRETQVVKLTRAAPRPEQTATP